MALKLRLNRKMYQVMSNVDNLQSLRSSFWGKPVTSKKGLRKKACPWFLFTPSSGVFSAFGKNSTVPKSRKGPCDSNALEIGKYRSRANPTRAVNHKYFNVALLVKLVQSVLGFTGIYVLTLGSKTSAAGLSGPMYMLCNGEE